MAAVAVGELLLDDGGLQARSEPADLSLGGETVVLQHGGGDDGVTGVDRAVTVLAAPLRHAPNPAYLHLHLISQLALPVRNLLTFVTAVKVFFS